MASTGQDRTRLLLGLMAALVVVLVWMNRDSLMPKDRDGGAAAEAQALGARLASLQGLPNLELDRPISGADYARSRDLFTFSQSPEDVRRTEALQEKKAVQRADAEIRRKERQEKDKLRRENQKDRKPIQREAPLPDFKYTYVGYHGYLVQPVSYYAVLTKSGGKSDVKKDDVRVVRVGEIIDNDFVVKKIGMDSLTIGYTNPKHREKTKTVKLRIPKQSASSGGRSGRKGRR